jgi:hypothetical protein
MAHFAKIENNIVTNIVVIDNQYEEDGEAYLNSIGLDGTWIQTSYNKNIRGKFAGLGDVYNSQKDRFEPARPYVSWIWNEELYTWQAPKPYPTDGRGYQWNEEIQNWEVIKVTE